MVNSVQILNYRSRVTRYDVLHKFLGEPLDTNYGATEVMFLTKPNEWGELDIHRQIADAFLTSPRMAFQTENTEKRGDISVSLLTKGPGPDII